MFNEFQRSVNVRFVSEQSLRRRIMIVVSSCIESVEKCVFKVVSMSKDSITDFTLSSKRDIEHIPSEAMKMVSPF